MTNGQLASRCWWMGFLAGVCIGGAATALAHSLGWWQ